MKVCIVAAVLGWLETALGQDDVVDGNSGVEDLADFLDKHNLRKFSATIYFMFARKSQL